VSCFGDAQDDANMYVELFGCGQVQFIIRYLGITIHYQRLAKGDWKLMEG
jgi:branched-subunit amino acid transport protein